MSRPEVFYFDSNATTQVAPEVIQAMWPILTDCWCNASSPYQLGREASDYVREARAKVAALVKASPEEIVFTSCGTESNNTAIHAALMSESAKRHVVTTAVEHKATLNFCESLQRRGCEVTYLLVNSDGSLDLDLLEKAIRTTTAIVTAMWANNESGTLFPVEEMAEMAHEKCDLC